MKTNTRPQRVPTRFDRATRFKLRPRLAADNGDQARVFQQLKTRLLNPVLDQTRDPEVQRHLRLAANEAAAAAWSTEFPLLLLPVLIEEKAAEVHQYSLRREQVQHATQDLAETGV